MSNIDKRALREAAEKATKGQWAVEFDDEIYSTDGVNNEQIAMVFSENEARDAAFIAAANPVTVLALLDELEAKDKSIDFLKDQLAQLANFNPDFDKLEAATDSLREHMDELTAARTRIAELEALQRKPVMFIDGDISPSDAEKLAAVISEFNEETETPAARMARIIRENPHPTNMCDMPGAGTAKGE
ncbi:MULTISPECIES: ead/Ea22-like family protein [Enterobacter cloacae complex]|jgi:DNA repair exonuclease SbcCD ATPase subunit|uniref:ead/Ea22-like family protein n=1 Tax=Enterobacter cloacae complex TaxID=354276 RepID=UPI001C1A661D|nr:ead/Ea22-like family protein [Enterobacter hormaechei]MCO0819439.1 ead/Ea22-like family protein [Enterobacter hormaechei]MCO8007775.1 ead/Ea22-like family protein [Enterobacter hormaechei]MCO8012210.1 ead/Ea22-like family protein [Enterobacter hormaechei]HAS0762680.1 ead/Ea22-like family protein [Enterobacter hormaechei subsp. xiangfangensis]